MKRYQRLGFVSLSLAPIVLSADFVVFNCVNYGQSGGANALFNINESHYFQFKHDRAHKRKTLSKS